ncbi:MAG: hypothetical protein ACOYET_04590, partial [Bacillota bacterium]
MRLGRRDRAIAAVVAVACLFAGIGLAIATSQNRRPIGDTLEVFSHSSYPPAAVYVDDYQQGITVTAKAAVLMDTTTGTILYGKNEHQRRDPASTTKVMTAILALELGKPDDIV